jgi:hypothetical protein
MRRATFTTTDAVIVMRAIAADKPMRFSWTGPSGNETIYGMLERVARKQFGKRPLWEITVIEHPQPIQAVVDNHE